MTRYFTSLGITNVTWQDLAMMLIGLLLIWLGIFKRYEPLLLIPIGFGVLLTNAPLAGLYEPQAGTGILYLIHAAGIKTLIFPLLIFLGIGALTDFGPLLANPRTALLGAAAQFGIFGTVIGAVLIGFSLREAGSIGIIGGADGPTSIYTSQILAPHLLGPIAIAAYSYMALVPIIQPPIIKLLTTKAERLIRMAQLREVSWLERIAFPIILLLLCILLAPSSVPLIGMIAFGNLLRECGVVERLSKTAQNELINIVTIFLGLAVGATLKADVFFRWGTIGIFVLGIFAFALATASGVLLGKLMSRLSKSPINPMIGAAGVSAVPMAARVVQALGREEDPDNHLIMHAMGPNVAGVIGSAVAAGVLIRLLG
ncbi:MAG: glutaconyl-CoA decarboxylase subunit beta [Planctomycetales bacterium 4484_113]|nr:MAG: glutaconyl-CoA decarboxylase subunit beta [Planctomycetales bacterium 4484_113]